jgi:hypothetical protein
VRCVGSQVVPKNDRGTHDQALLRWVSLSRKRSGARPRPWPPDGLTGGGPQLAMPRNRFSASAASRSRLPTHLPWIGAASCGPMLREAAGGRVLARPQQTAGSSAIIGRGPVAQRESPAVSSGAPRRGRMCRDDQFTARAYCLAKSTSRDTPTAYADGGGNAQIGQNGSPCLHRPSRAWRTVEIPE